MGFFLYTFFHARMGYRFGETVSYWDYTRYSRTTSTSSWKWCFRHYMVLRWGGWVSANIGKIWILKRESGKYVGGWSLGGFWRIVCSAFLWLMRETRRDWRLRHRKITTRFQWISMGWAIVSRLFSISRSVVVAFLSCVYVYWDEINRNREGIIIMNTAADRISLETAALWYQ